MKSNYLRYKISRKHKNVYRIDKLNKNKKQCLQNKDHKDLCSFKSEKSEKTFTTFTKLLGGSLTGARKRKPEGFLTGKLLTHGMPLTETEKF